MKVRYGLRALADIAINQHAGDGVFQKDISGRQEIPLKYLDTIISGLRNSGLIRNTAGKRSGYTLMKAPAEISVYDVYRAFEPELTLANCLCESMECKRSDNCPAKDYWFELNQHLKMLMKSTSLKQVMLGTFNF
ncbi:MAG: Rrf2 family transcriptional regulator [Bacteroidales bacterium]|nr:Rrf2 family transcriptional regulator [Bacteroidales bacterium]